MEDERLESDSHTTNLAETFCKDFTCCGYYLKTLHDLLEHYEANHVRVEDDEDGIAPNFPFSVHPFLPPLFSTVASSGFSDRKRKSVFPMISGSNIISKATSSVELIHSSTESLCRDPAIDEKALSAFDVTVLPSKKARTSPSTSDVPASLTGEDSCLATNQDSSMHTPTLSHAPSPFAFPYMTSSPPMITVSPASLCASSSDDDEFVDYSAVGPEGAYIKYVTELHRRQKQQRLESPDEGKGRRKHQCLVPGCGKVYKNANGRPAFKYADSSQSF
jgi:hypothetical protein